MAIGFSAAQIVRDDRASIFGLNNSKFNDSVLAPPGVLTQGGLGDDKFSVEFRLNLESLLSVNIQQS